MQSDRFRARAEANRREAALAKDEALRRQLLLLADQWDWLAAELDRGEGRPATGPLLDPPKP